MLRRALRALAVVLVASAAAAPTSASAGVNVFIGSATIPSASVDASVVSPPATAAGDVPLPTVSNGTQTANLWVDSNGGTCTRQAVAGAYVDAQACSSMAAADTAATSGDTVRIQNGTGYAAQQLTNTSKTISYIGAGTGSVTFASLTLGSDTQQAVSNKAVSGVTINNGFAIQCTNNITVSGVRSLNLTYIESTHNTTISNSDFDGTPNDPVTDLVDLYSQEPRTQSCTHGKNNDSITFTGNQFHHARASSGSGHPDAVQIAHGGAGAGVNTDINFYRNKFYDNECPNMRWNAGDYSTVENNVFYASVLGPFATCDAGGLLDSGGCGDVAGSGPNSPDTPGTNACIFRFNTMVGAGDVQGTAKTGSPQVILTVGPQIWYANVLGSGFQNDCLGGGGTDGGNSGNPLGTFQYNLFTTSAPDMNCGGQNGSTGNVRVADRLLNIDGVPQSGSAAINFSTSLNSSFPSTDFLGTTRFSGSSPDDGAYEVG